MICEGRNVFLNAFTLADVNISLAEAVGIKSLNVFKGNMVIFKKFRCLNDNLLSLFTLDAKLRNTGCVFCKLEYVAFFLFFGFVEGGF